MWDGVRLYQSRRDAGLSQRDVAEAIGTCATTVSKWERRRQVPSPEHVAALAEYLGVSYAWLSIGLGPRQP